VKQKGQTLAAFKRVSFYDNIKTQLIDVFTGTDLNN
jgi:hypothetical protein